MGKVLKNSGEVEDFNPRKLYVSLVKSGLSNKAAASVVERVTPKIEDGSTTEQIYREVISDLMKDKEVNIKHLANYSLKKAINSLGPTGFIFERLLEAIFQAYGFRTRRDVVMDGMSGVTHEIDILAKRGNIHALVEAKYRNQKGVKVQIDVVMYSWARLMDIKEFAEANKGDFKNHKMWVVTNTKFTSNAIRYARYKGVVLVGWGYPHKGGLEELIVHKKIYPITSLPSVNEFVRDKLIGAGIVIARDLLMYTPNYLTSELSIPPNDAFRVIEEAHGLFDSISS